MTEFCVQCHRERREGYRSDSAGFICLSCAGVLDFIQVTPLPCGQQCVSFEGWDHYSRRFTVRRIRDLKKGDILPACGHRVEVKLKNKPRRRGWRFEVSAFPRGSTSPADFTLYGTLDSEIWVKK